MEKHADPQLVDSQIQSGDEMKKFKCNQCDKEFKCNNTLEMHISEVHSQMLTCDECDHTAKNDNNMEQHKVDKHRIEQLDGNSDSIHGNSERINEASQFTCSFCGEAFVTKIKHPCHTVYCPKRTKL